MFCFDVIVWWCKYNLTDFNFYECYVFKTLQRFGILQSMNCPSLHCIISVRLFGKPSKNMSIYMWLVSWVTRMMTCKCDPPLHPLPYFVQVCLRKCIYKYHRNIYWWSWTFVCTTGSYSLTYLFNAMLVWYVMMTLHFYVIGDYTPYYVYLMCP